MSMKLLCLWDSVLYVVSSPGITKQRCRKGIDIVSADMLKGSGIWLFVISIFGWPRVTQQFNTAGVPSQCKHCIQSMSHLTTFRC